VFHERHEICEYSFCILTIVALYNTQLRKTFFATVAGFQTCKILLRVKLHLSNIYIALRAV
jgi:hypothetical protein